MIAVAVVVSGFALLGVSAARHARWHEAFARQLAAQRLWRPGSEAEAAWTITAVEVVVGGAGLLALAFGATAAALTPFLVALTATGVAFVGLQVFLLLRRPGAPCGCDPTSDARVGIGTLVKAAWPAVAGGVGLVALPAEALDALSLPVACVAVLAGLGLTWVVDSLPGWLARR